MDLSGPEHYLEYPIKGPADQRMIGGIDKRALIAGPAAIRNEVLPKLALARDGGYLPDIDHGIPPDVPFVHYRYYIELLKAEYGIR